MKHLSSGTIQYYNSIIRMLFLEVNHMSLKAAICDDCRADRETVESMLRAFVSSEAIPCSVSCFDSAYRLLASPESFDLCLR